MIGMIELFTYLDTDTQQTYLFLRLLHFTKTPAPTKIAILAEQQNHRCCYCGVEFLTPPSGKTKGMKKWHEANKQHPRMMTIEHVVRKVDGGVAEWDNEVAACYRCNTRRGAVDAYTYFYYRETLDALRKRVRRVNKNDSRKRKKEREKL